MNTLEYVLKLDIWSLDLNKYVLPTDGGNNFQAKGFQILHPNVGIKLKIDRFHSNRMLI